LLTVLHDAIKVHQSLLGKAKILHRDISENNIIITDPETANGFSGMLIDLDLAKFNGERTTGRHMIGHAR
jgi:serine/threonine protein kinase